MTLHRIHHIHDHHVAHLNRHPQSATLTAIIRTKIKIMRKTKKNSKVKNNDFISV